MIRHFLSGRAPKGTRILLIESGSRTLAEGVIPLLKSDWASDFEMDLVTCYGGLPQGMPEGTRVFRVNDYGTPEKRRELVKELKARDYAFVGMICSAESIMTKWKWMIASRLPAKLFIVNENGDYFWFHLENAATLREFALVRMGMEGAGAIRTIARLVAFPFAVLYLLLYAFTVHAMRRLRLSSFRLSSKS